MYVRFSTTLPEHTNLVVFSRQDTQSTSTVLQRRVPDIIWKLQQQSAADMAHCVELTFGIRKFSPDFNKRSGEACSFCLAGEAFVPVFLLSNGYVSLL